MADNTLPKNRTVLEVLTQANQIAGNALHLNVYSDGISEARAKIIKRQLELKRQLENLELAQDFLSRYKD